eukprot:Hpha_TRINITY_DN22961_c0_g1::TRINITY_DN22961_c0_g1_i1::g.154068::m.154068
MSVFDAAIKAAPVVLAAASLSTRPMTPYRAGVQQTLLICGAGDIALVWEHGYIIGVVIFCAAFVRLLLATGFTPLRGILALPPALCVGMAAAVLRGYEGSQEDSSAAVAALRGIYMLLLVFVGWRLLARPRPVVSFGFFIGILANAFLFKAAPWGPDMNYWVRMGVYYGGCLSLVISA